MHEGFAVWLSGMVLALGAAYSGYRTLQRRKGSPKRSSDTFLVYGLAAAIIAAIAVLLTKG